MFYMINLKSQRELGLMREAGQIVAETFGVLARAIEPGISLRALDRIAEQALRDRGAEPLYKGYRGSHAGNPPFPGVICTSIDEEICHGLPDKRRLRRGQIIGIDVGLRYQGYCGDACVTFEVGPVEAPARHLLDVTRRCLYAGIEAARAGAYLGDIGIAIEGLAEAEGLSVVRDLTGHGVGRQLHEAPTVFHIRQPQRGARLRPGMVFTIEPMINAGGAARRTLDDGWTEVTADGTLSAQFEHTIAITPDGPEILTPWETEVA